MRLSVIYASLVVVLNIASLLVPTDASAGRSVSLPNLDMTMCGTIGGVWDNTSSTCSILQNGGTDGAAHTMFQIPAGTTLIISSGITFSLNNGFDRIDNYGTFTNNGTFRGFGSFTNFGTMNNSFSFDMNKFSPTSFNRGVINNNGTITLANASFNTQENRGTINNYNGSVFQLPINGKFLNVQTINNSGDLNISGYFRNRGTVITCNGTITVSGTGIFSGKSAITICP